MTAQRDGALPVSSSTRTDVTVTALFDDELGLERALDALYDAGTPRDLIEVVVSREAAIRFYAGARGHRAPRPPGRETWRYAGVGALVGFIGGVAIALVMVAWPGIDAPGGLALVQLVGPNVSTVGGAAVGAMIGAFKRQQPHERFARAAEASNAILFAVTARSPGDADVLSQLLARQGGRDIRVS